MSAVAFRFSAPQVTHPDQIVALYEGLRLVADVMCGLLAQPRYGLGCFNPAGEYLEAVRDAICRASDDLVEAVETIQPDKSSDAYGDVFSARAHILVLDKINCEGITTASVLAKELYSDEASS